MIAKRLSVLGVRAWQLHAGSLWSIVLCVALWIRAKTVDQSSRGNAERRAIFVGLWPPMLWLIGDSLERAAPPSRRGSRARSAAGRPRVARRRGVRLPGR